MLVCSGGRVSHFGQLVQKVARSARFQEEELQRKYGLPLGRCLNPSSSKYDSTVKDLTNLLNSLPLDLKLDCVFDEWKLLQLEEEPQEGDVRVEECWNYYFEKTNHAGEIKYPSVQTLFKVALSINHESAEVGRGFSSNQVMCELRTNMKEKMLNSRLIICDALKIYDNKPELVPIRKNLIAMARVAYKKYNMSLEEERKRRKQKENDENALKSYCKKKD
ncbi:unnamed protein product [Acanthoscelides obtectus]|uniref:HAT C-terminal dimerisation domain-containing protein n=1 Tax=Acanthoscelides obtectus TaxID=200917 RepID=A0A9P0Q6R3_ACAOB|nr:unnamed protein product [Acanthoscelides obtectus]CAK1670251.1 hypothetical protein AOBTE_LOCUS27509 [Acanthoscelides obtectus]